MDGLGLPYEILFMEDDSPDNGFDKELIVMGS